MFGGVTTQPDSDIEYMTYDDFGLEFFRRAVTVERIGKSVAGLAGRPIEFGPLGVGPAKIARVRANGSIGEPTVRAVSTQEPLRFLLLIPVDLDFVVALPATEHKFHADVTIELRLIARAARDLQIVVDIDPPSKQDVTVDMRADGLTSSVLRLVAGIDGELKRFIARYIGKELDKPRIQSSRIYDVGRQIDKA